MTNPQIENLEKVAQILASVPERFVFTGGGTIVLYVDEIIRDELRPTKDVDCVVEIFSRTEYYRLATMLREVGLSECKEPNAPIVLLDGCEILPKEFEEAEGKIKLFLQQWFGENQSNLEEAVANFLPSSSASREERAIKLINKFASL